MAGRHLVGQCRRQRGADRVGDGGQRQAPALHRQRMARHHERALGQHHVAGAERALVHRLVRRGQRLVGDQRARLGPAVGAHRPLLRAVGEVDGHVAAGDGDLDVDAHLVDRRRSGIVGEGFRLVGAGREAGDDVPAFTLGLVENALDRGQHRVAPVLAEQLVHAAVGEPAGGDLRAHVAERRLGEADIVADHAVEHLVPLARLVDLDLVELQPLHPGVLRGAPGAEPGRHAADVDPVRPDHGEGEQLALPEIGHVDADVVEVLAGHRRVVHQQHVAGGETIAPVARHRVGDDDAEVGDEVRHPADVLAEKLALRVDQRGAEVAHLVDHHVVGGALQIGGHLVGDGRQRAAHHFERDRVETLTHRRSSLRGR